MDCPTKIKDPATINGLAIADDVLIPITIDGYSVEGIKDTKAVIDDMEDINSKLHIVGVFITRWERTRIAQQLVDGLSEQIGDMLFTTTIRKSVKIAESTFLQGKGLIEHARNAPVLDDYRALIKEYMDKR